MASFTVKEGWLSIILLLVVGILLGVSIGVGIGKSLWADNNAHIAPTYSLDSGCTDQAGIHRPCYDNEPNSFYDFWHEATKNTTFSIEGKPVEITDIQIFYRQENRAKCYRQTENDCINWFCMSEHYYTYGNITYYPLGLENSQTYIVPMPPPTPTPTPTPQCYQIRYYLRYYPNTANTEPPWSAKFNPMAFEQIPQSYFGCDNAALQKVQYWNPYDKTWVEGTWGLTDYNYWKGTYTDLLTKEYESERTTR